MITFRGGFDSVVYQYPNPVHNWRDPQPYEKIPTRLTLVDSPARKGKALQCVIYPGDNYGSSGERAEVYSMFGEVGQILENEESGTQYYAVSVYLPESFQPPVNFDRWGIFQQLHGSDVYHAPPLFAIGATDNFYVQMYTGDIDTVNYNNPAKLHRTKYTLAPLVLGQWVDFVFCIRYAKDYTGSVMVWMRTEAEVNFRTVMLAEGIPTLQYKMSVNSGAVLDAYWKTGYYTSVESFTRVIYLDCHTRGDNFDEVVSVAFPVIEPVELWVKVTWDRGLNCRYKPSMHNAPYLVNISKDARVPIESIIENEEGTWAQINDRMYFAMYLKSNGKTYAVKV